MPKLEIIFRAAKSASRCFIENYQYLERLEALKREIDKAKPKKIVVGAGETAYPGWVVTNIHNLDITSTNNWTYVFTRNTVDNLLAEHVFEHLTLKQAREAFKLAFQFLKPGGTFRIAVPDGLFPSDDYINYVRPGGVGAGADDHKMMYTHRILREELGNVGFDVKLLEYWNEQGDFIFCDWETENNGMVKRTKRYDQRNSDGKLRYTSLLVDAHKLAL